MNNGRTGDDRGIGVEFYSIQISSRQKIIAHRDWFDDMRSDSRHNENLMTDVKFIRGGERVYIRNYDIDRSGLGTEISFGDRQQEIDGAFKRDYSNAQWSNPGNPVTFDLRPSTFDLKYIPIVDVRPGDYVLSLNEDTQRIEPHRINGLLDMGIKPVFELITETGKSIETTGNHPYLVKVEGGRWKVEGQWQQEREAIARQRVSEIAQERGLAVEDFSEEREFAGPKHIWQGSAPDLGFQGRQALTDINSHRDLSLHGFKSGGKFISQGINLFIDSSVETINLFVHPLNFYLQSSQLRSNNILQGLLDTFVYISRHSNLPCYLKDTTYKVICQVQNQELAYAYAPNDVVRGDWLKVIYLEEGDEIAVAKEDIAVINNYLTRKLPSSSTYNLLLNSLGGTLFNNLPNAETTLSGDGGWILIRMIPEYFSGGYINIFEKWMSWVTNTLFSMEAACITVPFSLPDTVRLISWPDSTRNLSTSEPIFSSKKNFISDSRKERGIFFALNQLCRKMERRLDRIDSEVRVGFNNLLNCFPCLQKFQDKIDHYACSFKTWLAMANFRVYADIIFNSHFTTSFVEKVYHRLDNLSSNAYASLVQPLPEHLTEQYEFSDTQVIWKLSPPTVVQGEGSSNEFIYERQRGHRDSEVLDFARTVISDTFIVRACREECAMVLDSLRSLEQ